MSQILKFKTNINCGGCIKSVTPHLDKAEGINKWEVDTDNPDKILSVETDRLTAEEVITIIDNAGYTAQITG
ncbi:MAG: heavy-metal-associated domain-containing protein [Bacteroidales bacterium]|nr:heavy-metal-associated domain-containing protein [Bacteroidales bacterium]